MKSDFEFQPTLEGVRVVIRPVATSDWDSMFAAAADPAIWQQHPVAERYTEKVFRTYFDDAIACGSAFAFVDRQSGQVIGSSRYHGFDPVASEIEIGWTFLARNYWGGSYNDEIKQLLLGHAFQFVNTVVFWVGETNLRSRRAMEKTGGVLREGMHSRDIGGGAPNVIYEISNET